MLRECLEGGRDGGLEFLKGGFGRNAVKPCNPAEQQPSCAPEAGQCGREQPLPDGGVVGMVMIMGQSQRLARGEAGCNQLGGFILGGGHGHGDKRRGRWKAEGGT